MITYSKTYWGLHLLLRLYGSALPRTLPFAIISAGLTALFTYVPYKNYFNSVFEHPYPYQLFAFIVGFALVFRTNFGYSRYWEGRTQLQTMSAALSDVCCRALTFEASTLLPDDEEEEGDEMLDAAPGKQPSPQQREDGKGGSSINGQGPFQEGAPPPPSGLPNGCLNSEPPLQPQRERADSAAAAAGQLPMPLAPFHTPPSSTLITEGEGESGSDATQHAQQGQQTQRQQEQHHVAVGREVSVLVDDSCPPGFIELVPTPAGPAEVMVGHPPIYPVPDDPEEVGVEGERRRARSGGAWGQDKLNSFWGEQQKLQTASGQLHLQGDLPSRVHPDVPQAGGHSWRGPREEHECRAESPSRSRLSRPQLRRYVRFRNELLHLASLFHALALQHLRVDWKLDNLSEHVQKGTPPPLDSRGLRDYKIYWLDLFILRGKPKAREAFNSAMKLPVVGKLSWKRRQLLGERHEADPQIITETLMTGLDRGDSSVRGIFRLSFLEQQTGSMIEGGPERVYTAYNWLQLLMAGRTRPGPSTWKHAAPITALIWNQLSRCYASFEQCRKLADTPFPFPWSQNIVMFLLIYTFTVPIMMAAYVDRAWLGVILTFFSVLTYWALNEVARDLEDPFIYDPNDLPLARIQYDFNKRILAASNAILLALQNRTQ